MANKLSNTAILDGTHVRDACYEDNVANFRYRHYIHLDSDPIRNVAAIIEGGEVSEELRILTRGSCGNTGVQPGFAALDANLGLQGSRFYLKEWKLLRTAYVGANEALSKLAAKKPAPAEAPAFSENMINQGDVNLYPLRSHSSEDQPRAEVKKSLCPWRKGLSAADRAVKARLRNVREYGSRRHKLAGTFDSDGNDLSGRELHDKAARVRTPIIASRPGYPAFKPTDQESLRRR